MNFKKILASVAAAALAVSSMAVCSFAAVTEIPVTVKLFAQAGAPGYEWSDAGDVSATITADGAEAKLSWSNVGTKDTTTVPEISTSGIQVSAASEFIGEKVKVEITDILLDGTAANDISAEKEFVANWDSSGAEIMINELDLKDYMGKAVSCTVTLTLVATSDSGDDTDSESDEPNYDIPDRPAEDTSAATEATSAPEETTTEEEAAPEAGTFKGSHTMSDSSWWTQDQIVDFEAGLTDLTVLIGGLDPASVASIAFSSDTAFFVGYNGKDGTWHQNADPVTSLTLTDVLLVEDGDKAPALHIMISKGDGVEYTINWVVTTGDAPATTEDTSASEAAPEDTSETSVVVEPGPVETTAEETNAGNSEDGNQPTGIVLAVIPAAAAVAGVIVSRKRS